MFPKKAVGSVVGIGGMAGGLGGVVTSKLGGALFDHYKALGHTETGYSIMFAICAVASFSSLDCNEIISTQVQTHRRPVMNRAKIYRGEHFYAVTIACPIMPSRDISEWLS